MSKTLSDIPLLPMCSNVFSLFQWNANSKDFLAVDDRLGASKCENRTSSQKKSLLTRRDTSIQALELSMVELKANPSIHWTIWGFAINQLSGGGRIDQSINDNDYKVGIDINQYQCNEIDILVSALFSMHCGCVCKSQLGAGFAPPPLVLRCCTVTWLSSAKERKQGHISTRTQNRA